MHELLNVFGLVRPDCIFWILFTLYLKGFEIYTLHPHMHHMICLQMALCKILCGLQNRVKSLYSFNGLSVIDINVHPCTVCTYWFMLIVAHVTFTLLCPFNNETLHKV